MKYRFLADENVPRICALAESENRIIITNDKDFGDLVMRFRLNVPGVLLLRLNGLMPNEMADLVVEAFTQDHDWINHFAVVTKETLRIRPLPGAS
jgi:predicted nuclease of predicted toxin-antitoxin system